MTTATGPQLPQPGDTVAGKYRIERVLGAGGMGAVFEATHEVTGKKFAVKWLLPDLSGHADAIKRFIREAQVAGRFEHPNVVEVYDVGEVQGSFFMVMELLHGESLAQRLRTRGRLSPPEACALLIPCMHGVARAHEAGVVHRDLKPDNIFVCNDAHQGEHPKVLDFGISRMSSMAGEVNPSITKTGMVMGTPHYMSPEQIRGRDMDHRVDIYAFGVILYQLLSGWLPFPGDTYSDLVLKIATEQPKPLAEHNPTLPQALIAIVNKAMARSPDARFQTLDELANALMPYSGGAFAARTPSTGRPIGAAQQPPSGGHVRKATPSSGTIRLETPLATQSTPMLERVEASSGRSLLTIGLAVVAAAVVALVIVAVMLLNRDPEVASDPGPSVDDKAAAGTQAPLEKASPDAPKAAQPSDQPVVNTVRVAPDAPQPERHWEPPAAGAQPQQPRPEDKAPIAAAADSEPRAPADVASDRPSKSSTKKTKKRDPGSPPAPPMPSATATPATPSASTGKAQQPAAGSAGKGAPGRLGVRMDEGEF